eukprot:5155932-Prymnesium_polylepis.1
MLVGAAQVRTMLHQQLDSRREALTCCHVQRRVARGGCDVRACAVVEQRLRDAHVALGECHPERGLALHDRGIDWSAALEEQPRGVLVAKKGAQVQRRAGLDAVAYDHVVDGGARVDQHRQQGRVARLCRHVQRPAPCVGRRVRVGAAAEEKPRRLDVPVSHGGVERRVAVLVLRAHEGPSVEQQRGDRVVALAGGQ